MSKITRTGLLLHCYLKTNPEGEFLEHSSRLSHQTILPPPIIPHATQFQDGWLVLFLQDLVNATHRGLYRLYEEEGMRFRGVSKVETRPLSGCKHGVAFLLVGGFQQVTPQSAPLGIRNHPVISVLLFLFSQGLFH